MIVCDFCKDKAFEKITLPTRCKRYNKQNDEGEIKMREYDVCYKCIDRINRVLVSDGIIKDIVVI